MGLPEWVIARKEYLFPAAGMGAPGSSGAGGVLSRTPGDVLANSPQILQWARADRNVFNGGLGHADDHGVAQAFTGFASLLLIRGPDPRVPGRAIGAAS